MTQAVQHIELLWPTDVAAAVGSFAGSGGVLAWLDTSDAGVGSVSVVGVEPIARLAQFPGRRAVFRVGEAIVTESDNAWELWRDVHARIAGPMAPAAEWPGRGIGATGATVTPGWMGHVAFEAARQLERLPERLLLDPDRPLIELGLFDAVVVLDHARRAARLVAAPELRSRLGLEEAGYGPLVERWNAASGSGAVPYETPVRRLGRETGGTPVAPASGTTQPPVRFEQPRDAYERMVRRAVEYIAAGDVYQVNLAQRITIDSVGDHLEAYARLRRVNPAPYGALLRSGDRAIASVSPELFLSCHEGRVRTRPIKGTRPRSGDKDRDARAVAELLGSEKEAAELAMIVDLHRNDIGRVCRPGSVRVAAAREVETHPTVFHTVAEVTGTLAAGKTSLDLLAACFPAGSVSGVPKIRALEIIDELEAVARGAYTGAVVRLGLDGGLDANVAIRTLQVRGNTATLYVGGGIVAESEPASEYAETLAKARGILNAFGAGAAATAGANQRETACVSGSA